MLTQIVKPMVRTQLRLLAGCQSTRSTLTSTICQWLGFLGVQAEVNQLQCDHSAIQVSLTVGKPDACDPRDWDKIIHHLSRDAHDPALTPDTTRRQRTLVRLFAYLLQVGHSEGSVNWEDMGPKLKALNFDKASLEAIRSAVRVPQSLDFFAHELDADIAAIALPKAVSIALMDRTVNASEEQVLNTLFDLMKPEMSAAS